MIFPNIEPKNLVAEKSARDHSKRGVPGKPVKLNLPSDVTTAGAAAADPHPTFRYHGGAVVNNPQVYALFLGDWKSTADQARAARLSQYLTDLAGSHYMNILSQYG